ncbi:BTAD domain-containing putative transcriptional regulator [Paenibacillus thalictri]|uniref:Response regulator n=1 Tax=Paenibacillus thalictri TaxID=2527873 RepID=A0A4Q9DZJ5_9BACL|nr:BTAD domain-containing putative transcriptional regulator [Paenibacillus thalictri]TBL80701.1 response regulator [Paenibacillus thalictri]
MLRAIIVDDEELSVKRLKRILSDNDEIETCHTFLNPREAYEFAMEHPIDIAFLDISMPEISGMTLSGLLHEIDDTIHIVFVTGYEEYAIQAFDLDALDYLLKPVTMERISRTLSKAIKRTRTAVARSSMSVQLFNGLKIYRNGPDPDPIMLRTPKTEELFAYIISKGAVSREEITETLWSGLETKKALNNLNSTLYYIRKATNSETTENWLAVSRNEIRVEQSSVYCDLYEFEQLLKQLRQDSARSAELFKRAESLYTGPFLKGRSYEWAHEKTLRLEQNYIELLEAGARSCITGGQHERSLHYYCEILKLDPIREDICHEVIRLYAELGRRTEALRQYKWLEELLQRELGTSPDPVITEFVRNVQL